MSPFARRLALCLLATIYAFGFIDRVLIALVAEQLKADFGISDFEIGLLGGTAFAVVNALASLPIARMAGKYSRKWITALALAFASAFTALCAVTSSFTQMLVLRLGMAAGSAGTESPAHAMISDMYEARKRAGALSVLMMGIPVASILGSTLGGSIAQAYGWRATFATIGLLGLGVALLAMWLVPEPSREQALDPAAEAARSPAGLLSVMGKLVRDPGLRHLLIGTCIMGLASFGVNTFLPAFFTRNFGLDAGEAGLAFGMLTGIGSLVGTVLGGFGAQWLSHRHPAWLVAWPGLGAILGGPIYFLGLMQHELAVAFPIMLAGACLTFMVMGPAIAAIHNVVEVRERALGSAVFLLMLNFVGQGFGPPLAGLVSDLASAASYAGGDFAAHCLGTRADAACAAASAAGLKIAIACASVLFVWSGLHLAWAGHRHVRHVDA